MAAPLGTVEIVLLKFIVDVDECFNKVHKQTIHML